MIGEFIGRVPGLPPLREQFKLACGPACVTSYQVSRVLVSSWFSPLRRELPVAREMLR
jgi:hypothetical protein